MLAFDLLFGRESWQFLGPGGFGAECRHGGVGSLPVVLFLAEVHRADGQEVTRAFPADHGLWLGRAIGAHAGKL